MAPVKYFFIVILKKCPFVEIVFDAIVEIVFDAMRKACSKKKLFMLRVCYICLSLELTNDGCVAYR
jgi:hypothetical protein